MPGRCTALLLPYCLWLPRPIVRDGSKKPATPTTPPYSETARGSVRLRPLGVAESECSGKRKAHSDGSGCYKDCLVYTKMKRLVSTVLGTSDPILLGQRHKSHSPPVGPTENPNQPCQLPNGPQHPCSKSTPTPPVSATPKPRAGGAGIPLRTPIDRRLRLCCRTYRDWIPNRRDSSVNLGNWPRGFCAGGGIRIRRG